jgi:hypothetical protein
VVFDKVPELLGDFTQLAANDYGTQRKEISVQNPQANA